MAPNTVFGVQTGIVVVWIGISKVRCLYLGGCKETVVLHAEEARGFTVLQSVTDGCTLLSVILHGIH
jgi:hypothetical protein